MNPQLVLAAVLKYGPSVLPVIQQIIGWIKAGKTDVTPEDIATLVAYGKKTAADYLAEAGGPPDAPAKTPGPNPAGVGFPGDDPPLNPN